MASDRIQRRIDSLLDEADQAISQSDWAAVRDRAQNVLALDPDNSDANAFIAAADRAQGSASPPPPSHSSALAPAAVTPPVSAVIFPCPTKVASNVSLLVI
mgnify:CR=1 FL=1